MLLRVVLVLPILVLVFFPSSSSSTVVGGAPSFGHGLLPLFQMRPGYINLNHGSYGSPPRVVIDRLRYWQDEMELNTDDWFRYRMFDYFEAERKIVASYVGANQSDLVFIPNASHGCNSVLRSLYPSSTRRNKVLYLSTAYGMVKNVLAYLHNQPILQEDLVMVNVSYPFNPHQLLSSVEAALKLAQGQIYLASFSHITSIPSFILPVVELAKLCHSYNVMVLIDGAHALGQIPLNIPSLGVDFYVANAHKWGYTPKGTAIMWVTPALQHLIWPTTISGEGIGVSQYVMQFSYEGTLDYSAYLTFSAALTFRAQFGEAAIMNYIHTLANNGGNILSSKWKTDWLIPGESIGAMVNVRLPTEGSSVDPLSLMKTLLDKYNTWVNRRDNRERLLVHVVRKRNDLYGVLLNMLNRCLFILRMGNGMFVSVHKSIMRKQILFILPMLLWQSFIHHYNHHP